MEISSLQHAHSIILNHELKLFSSDLPIQLQTVMSMQQETAVKVCISIQAFEMTSKLPHSTYCSKKLFHQSPIAFSQWWVLKPNIRLPWSVTIIQSSAVTANFRTFLESIGLITTVDFSFPHIRVIHPSRNEFWKEWIELNDFHRTKKTVFSLHIFHMIRQLRPDLFSLSV